MAAAPARPVTDFETRQHKADGNGELLYNLQVVWLEDDGAQIITVKVPGDPQVAQGAMLAARGPDGDPVVDERSLGPAVGHRVSREPDQGDRGRRRVGERPRVREGRGLGTARVLADIGRACRERARLGCSGESASATSSQTLVIGIVWALWGVRVELGALLALAAIQRVVAEQVGDLGGWLAVAALIVAVLVIAPARRFVWRLLRAMRVRRAWARATIDAGVAAGPFRCPGVWSVTRVAAGDVLDVRVRRGQAVAELEQRSEHLAACLRARELRVVRDRRDAARAQRAGRAARSVRGRRADHVAARRRRGGVAVGADPGRRRRAGRGGGDRAGRAQHPARRRTRRGQVGGAVGAAGGRRA